MTNGISKPARDGGIRSRVASRVVLDRRAVAGGLAAALLAAAAFLPSTVAAAPDRVVIALDPPSTETYRYWNTGGGFGGIDPAFQMLIGNDRETGAYDNSGLAESWEANEDFTEWTFRIHADAEFHFGWGPVTAADVVHSHAIHTAEDSTLTGVQLLRGGEVEAVDEKTVVFRFPEPRQGFEFAHAGRGSLYIFSKAQFDAEGIAGYDAKPAGTGVFQIVESSPGRILFERVPDHWSGIAPTFPELEFRYTTEGATKLALLLSGEAHVVVLPRELHADAIEAGFEIVSSTGPAMQTAWLFNGQYTLPDDDVLNPDLPWLDVRIREAINRAIDREALMDVLYDGRAEPLVQFAMDPRHEGWNQDIADRFEEMYGYDPDRAKALLEEAGYPDNFANPVIPILSTALAGNPEFGTMAELMQVFMDDIGLVTEIRELDWAGLSALRRAREAQVTHPMRNAPVRPTEVGIDAYFSSFGRPFNVYEDPEVDAVVAEYKQTLDLEGRDRLAQEIFRLLFENYASVPIAAVAADVVINPEHVSGWTFPGVTSAGISHFHLVEPANN